MARVVVIGGGLAGIATAARLAKLRHQVVLCERAPELGGALRAVRASGLEWDGGAATTTLPAVLRDLFRKTGRPMERELALAPVATPRRHHFDDGTVLDLPVTGRGAQHEALTAVVGTRAAEQWASLIDRQGEVWEVLRRRALEVAFGGCDTLSRAEQRLLRQRLSLHRLSRSTLGDARLRSMLGHPTVLAGSRPQDTPAYVAVEPYLERSFGVWRPEGGMAALVDVLADRLATRKVDVRLGAEVRRIEERAGRADTVILSDGTRLRADAVVAAIDARAVHALMDRPLPTAWQRLTPAVPPSVTHLGLEPGAPDLSFETVLHGDPLLVVRGESPHTCTVLVHGALHEDALTALARRGIDLRPHVTTRVDRSPTEIVAASQGSPYGLAWRGPRTAVHRAAPARPVGGVHLVGASAHPGAGVPLVGLGAAQCAEVIHDAGAAGR